MSCVWAAPDRQEAHYFQTLREVKDDNVAAHQFDTALQNDAELVLGVKDPHEKQKRTFVYDVCRKNSWSVGGYFEVFTHLVQLDTSHILTVSRSMVPNANHSLVV